MIAYLFKWILNTQGGILNELLMHFSIISEPVGWLSTSATAFPCVILVSMWKGYPLVMVQILAGIQTISHDLYEAAEIDGANMWQRFRYVTLPALKPILTTILILDTVWVFKQFYHGICHRNLQECVLLLQVWLCIGTVRIHSCNLLPYRSCVQEVIT